MSAAPDFVLADGYPIRRDVFERLRARGDPPKRKAPHAWRQRGAAGKPTESAPVLTSTQIRSLIRLLRVIQGPFFGVGWKIERIIADLDIELEQRGAL
jgi:hypothetical protein